MEIKDIINKGLAEGMLDKDIAQECVNILGCSYDTAIKSVEIYKYLLA